MAVNLKKQLEIQTLQEIKLRSPVCVQTGSSIKATLHQMRENRRGCAIIVDGEKIVGLFTERDLLNRVIGNQVDLKGPIDGVMTPNPSFLRLSHPIVDAIVLMSQKGYRHIPLVDDQGKIQGFVSDRDLVDYLSENFPSQVYNLPPDPIQISKTPEGA